MSELLQKSGCVVRCNVKARVIQEFMKGPCPGIDAYCRVRIVPPLCLIPSVIVAIKADQKFVTYSGRQFCSKFELIS